MKYATIMFNVLMESNHETQIVIEEEREPPTCGSVQQLVSSRFDLLILRWCVWPEKKNLRAINSDHEHADLWPVHCGLSDLRIWIKTSRPHAMSKNILQQIIVSDECQEVEICSLNVLYISTN